MVLVPKEERSQFLLSPNVFILTAQKQRHLLGAQKRSSRLHLGGAPGAYSVAGQLLRFPRPLAAIACAPKLRHGPLAEYGGMKWFN